MLFCRIYRFCFVRFHHIVFFLRLSQTIQAQSKPFGRHSVFLFHWKDKPSPRAVSLLEAHELLGDLQHSAAVDGSALAELEDGLADHGAR